MIKVVDLKGKFLLVDDEYVLSVQASIIVSKDEDGYVQKDYFEFVKVLDEDGFEIDEISLSFNPAYPDQELFATNVLSLEDKSQIKEIKSLQFFNKLVDVEDLNTNQKNISLMNKLEKRALTSSSQWVPQLAAKIVSKPEEIIVSVKASLCPQPDEDHEVQDEYFEFVKLLDEEGFQLEEFGVNFSSTQPLKITNSTAKTEFYDLSLANKIKYIQLLDAIVCINPSSKSSYRQSSESKETSTYNTDKEPEIYQKSSASYRTKSSCIACNAEVPLGVDICDECRAEKLKKIHGAETKPSTEINKKQTGYCEQCKCEVPLGAKICDFCRSQQLKKIHSGEKNTVRTTASAYPSTPKSEWKPWPPKAPPPIHQTKKEPESIGVMGWIIIVVIGFFLLVTCFG